MNPAVSVVIPLHNSSDFMAEGVESVLRQSFGDLELILVDDCSADDSLARAHDFAARDERVVVVAMPENGGGGASRNAGIAQAKGRYVAFLDADDLWEPDKLEIQLDQMDKKNAAFSYTDYAVFSDGVEGEKIRKTPEKVSYHELLKNTVIGCSTVVYDRQMLGDRYFPLIRKRQDFALWLSILRDVDFAWRCGPALTRHRRRAGSVSANKLKAALFTWKVYREVEALPLLPSAYYFLHYALAATRKRL